MSGIMTDYSVYSCPAPGSTNWPVKGPPVQPPPAASGPVFACPKCGTNLKVVMTQDPTTCGQQRSSTAVASPNEGSSQNPPIFSKGYCPDYYSDEFYSEDSMRAREKKKMEQEDEGDEGYSEPSSNTRARERRRMEQTVTQRTMDDRRMANVANHNAQKLSKFKIAG